MDVVIHVILIFILRVMNYAIGTLRLVSITRGRRFVAGSLAMLEGLVFAVVIAGVVNDLQNIPNLLAYCLGAGVGSWVGMELESRLVRSYTIVNVFASSGGTQITETLRNAGYGVTTTISQGRDGDVMMIRSVIDKRQVKPFTKIVENLNDKAFIAVEEVRGVERGWLGVGRGGKFS
jgi:uncharacterized protein YebE (UPF0316 family)